MIATRYKPEAVVTFYTEKGELVVKASNDPSAKMDDDVISITTVRDMGADAPTFSINLVNRKPWHKMIGANDLAIITMRRPPESQEVVFVGLVDDCRKRVVAGDTPQRVITVSGRGVGGKAFCHSDGSSVLFGSMLGIIDGSP